MADSWNAGHRLLGDTRHIRFLSHMAMIKGYLARSVLTGQYCVGVSLDDVPKTCFVYIVIDISFTKGLE